MKKPESPCKDCGEREPGCHGHCESYLEYVEYKTFYKEELRRLQSVDYETFEAIKSSMRRAQKRNNRK